MENQFQFSGAIPPLGGQLNDNGMNGEAEKDTERHNFNGSITEKRSNLFYSEIQKKKANGETELR